MHDRQAAAALDREGRRRREPRLRDTDWMVLRRMHRAIDSVAGRLAHAGVEALDLGCGAMPYAPLFTSRGARYRGADLEDAELIIGVDGRVPLPDASVDLLLSFQVLEHVRDLDAYLGEARRLLRPSGRLILSTHGTWLYHPHPEDHRRWTAEGLRHDIEARGFEMLECTSLVGPLAWTTMVRLTCFATALRGLPLIGRPLAALVAWVMNLRAAIEDRITPQWVTRDNGCVYLTVSRPRGA
jgi:SAM-dependent methyltransferase